MRRYYGWWVCVTLITFVTFVSLFGLGNLRLGILLSVQRIIAVSLGLFLLLGTTNTLLVAQESSEDGARKILVRPAPVYPEIAHKLHLEGMVRLQVTVAPNGTMKSVEVMGGSPVFIKAAEETVSKFRWVPANQESRELVEIKFVPR